MDSGKWALAAFALGAAMAFTITVVVRLCIAERESERKDAEGAREEAAHAAEDSEAANPQPTLRKSEVNGTSSAAGAKDSKEATTKAASPRDGKGAIAVAAGPSVTAEASALAADSSAAEFVATPEATELATASHGAPAAPEPDAAPEPAAPGHAAPLDMEELTATLLRSADPIADLKHEAGRIRTAEAHAADDGGIEPSGLDSYLARALDDGELVAYLHCVLVDPAYQGQGIASGLIAQMKERFRNYLYLEVMPQGEQERPPSTSVRASPSCKTASRCRSATSRTSAWPAWRLSRTA